MKLRQVRKGLKPCGDIALFEMQMPVFADGNPNPELLNPLSQVSQSASGG